MQQVYDEVKTPFKYGVVIRGENEKDSWVDCPSIFRHNDQWYMVYISYDNVGYETYLARVPTCCIGRNWGRS